MESANASQPLRLGDIVPHFTARTTSGPVDLADYRGRWLILFSHPADFTPVCTSEFIALAQAAHRFEALDCALMALSVDSLYSHLAWIRMIHDMSGVRIGFPIIEDPTMAIARAYGMIAPDAQDAATVRATCFIDPDGVLRAMNSYPVTVGRSIPEMLRMLAALQRAQGGRALVPADWQPGDDLLAPPVETVDQALAGEKAGEWFYRPVRDRR